LILFIRRAADPSLQDSAGNTPAHLAAMQGHLLVLTALVKVSKTLHDRATSGLCVGLQYQDRHTREMTCPSA
jgi:ankyrin repeat protein